MIDLFIVLAALATACYCASLAVRSLQKQLDAERRVTADLHTRLATRNLIEYQAFTDPAPASEPEDDEEYLSDPTGLFRVAVSDLEDVQGSYT